MRRLTELRREVTAMNKQLNEPIVSPEIKDGKLQAARRVLIVEDESMVAMLIEDTLADLGYEVAECASRIEDAMDKISSLTFDAAILDVNLNGVETFELADELGRKKIPFIFATGYGPAKLPERFCGISILQKPFRQTDLEKALNAAFNSGMTE
jgi:CheY-like chemotaxis protein